jgi:hypothetical protein
MTSASAGLAEPEFASAHSATVALLAAWGFFGRSVISVQGEVVWP